MEFKQGDFEQKRINPFENYFDNGDELDGDLGVNDKTPEQKKFQNLMELNSVVLRDPINGLNNVALYIPSIEPFPFKEAIDNDLIPFYVEYTKSDNPCIFEPAATIITNLVFRYPEQFAPAAIIAGYVEILRKLLEFAKCNDFPQTTCLALMRSVAILSEFEEGLFQEYAEFFDFMLTIEDPLLQCVCVECIEKITRKDVYEELKPIVFKIDWSYPDEKYIKCGLNALKNLGFKNIIVFSEELCEEVMNIDLNVFGRELLTFLLVVSTKSDDACQIIANYMEKIKQFFDVDALKTCKILLNIAGSDFAEMIDQSVIDILIEIYREGTSSQKSEALKVILQRIVKLKPDLESLGDEIEIVEDALSFNNKDLHILALSCLNGLEYFTEEIVDQVGDLELETEDPTELLYIRKYLENADKNREED